MMCRASSVKPLHINVISGGRPDQHVWIVFRGNIHHGHCLCPLLLHSNGPRCGPQWQHRLVLHLGLRWQGRLLTTSYSSCPLVTHLFMMLRLFYFSSFLICHHIIAHHCGSGCGQVGLWVFSHVHATWHGWRTSGWLLLNFIVQHVWQAGHWAILWWFDLFLLIFFDVGN